MRPSRRAPPKVLGEGDVFIDPIELQTAVRKSLSQTWAPPPPPPTNGNPHQDGTLALEEEKPPTFVDPLSLRKSRASTAWSGWGDGDETPTPVKIEPPKRKTRVARDSITTPKVPAY